MLFLDGNYAEKRTETIMNTIHPRAIPAQSISDCILDQLQAELVNPDALADVIAAQTDTARAYSTDVDFSCPAHEVAE